MSDLWFTTRGLFICSYLFILFVLFVEFLSVSKVQLKGNTSTSSWGLPSAVILMAANPVLCVVPIQTNQKQSFESMLTLKPWWLLSYQTRLRYSAGRCRRSFRTGPRSDRNRCVPTWRWFGDRQIPNGRDSAWCSLKRPSRTRKKNREREREREK